MRSLPGAFCTVLLHTRDVAAAGRFYGALFGWESHRDDAGTCFTLRGRRVAGTRLVARDTDSWIPYVAVEHVDRSTHAAVDAGGTVIENVSAPTAARPLSVITDPGGAVFGLCAPNDEHAVSLMQAPGSIWWIEVLTHLSDTLRSIYGALFQWSFVDQALAPHPLYVTCMHGDSPVAGILPIGPGWTTTPRWQVLFAVDSLESSVEQGARSGGHVEFGPLDVPGAGRLTSVRDPQGALFVLMQPRH